MIEIAGKEKVNNLVMMSSPLRPLAAACRCAAVLNISIDKLDPVVRAGRGIGGAAGRGIGGVAGWAGCLEGLPSR